MAKAKAKQKAPQKTQAQRFLEAAKERSVTDNSFARAAGKLQLQRGARKTGKGQVG
jgi:hypothetical protein